MTNLASIGPDTGLNTGKVAKALSQGETTPALVEAAKDAAPDLLKTAAEALAKPVKDNRSIAERYSEVKFIVDKLGFLMNDKNPLRKMFALSNELAEAGKETLSNMPLPDSVKQIAYGGLWAMSFTAAFARGAVKFLTAKRGYGMREASRIFTQDLIAAISIPTAVANMMNTIQNKIYRGAKLPDKLIDLIRPVGSMAACFVAIGLADPVGKKAGDWVAGHVNKFSNGDSKLVAANDNETPLQDIHKSVEATAV